jgi:hypothetical protein
VPMKRKMIRKDKMVKNFTSRWSIGRICNDQWLLSSSLKSHKIKMIRMMSGFMFRKERVLTWMRSFLVVLFFLAAEGAIRDGAFLLSKPELVRVGSSVAYLDISWAKVGDWYPKAEIGPYRRLSWQVGQVLYLAENDKALISKEGHDWR